MAVRTELTFSAATVSWIDPASGLAEVDKGCPPGVLTFGELKDARICRFANVIICSITVQRGKIADLRVAPESGLYARPSFLCTPPVRYPSIPNYLCSGGAVVEQTVGCRTAAPELLGSLGGPLGREAAELIELGKTIPGALPPIWTTISLKMEASGACSAVVKAKSLFPSMTFYWTTPMPGVTAPGALVWFKQGHVYDGVPHFEDWRRLGWGKGNPWGIKDPANELNLFIR